MIHIPPQSPPADIRVIRVFRVKTINNQSSIINNQYYMIYVINVNYLGIYAVYTKYIIYLYS